MSAVYGSKWGSGFNVSVWMEHDGSTVETFNLSDSTGDHKVRSAKFRKLPPELQSAIKAAVVVARAECDQKLTAVQVSEAALSQVWRDDMIRYDSKPWGYADRTLAGTNYQEAKDCVELGTYLDLQFGKSMGGHAYDSRLSCYYGCLMDGGYAIDRHDVLDNNPSLSVRSPMLDTHTREVNRFKDKVAGQDTFMLDILADPGCFGGLATLAKAATVIDSLESFDYVPLSVWMAWWRDKGARIGQRRGNQIVWEDGAIEDIRPADQRYAVNGVIVKS